MDDIIGPLLLIFAVSFGGWVLGIVAFFRVQRALREIAGLRRRLAALAGEAPAGAAAPAEAEPDLEPWLRPAPAAEQPDWRTPEPRDWRTPPPPAGQPPAPAEPAEPPRDLEALLTQRWGLWLGAAALLLSGVFLIRYAVENALLGPAARCVAAALLGVALLAGAEWLRRRPPAGAAPAAMAAGGIAVLFGAAYGAGAFYALLPPALGFALMALAGATGLVASLRYGKLAAAVGVAGAFVTPALIPTESPSMPGLFAYLLAVTAASLAVVRYAAWTWLGWAATVAGATWVMISVAAMPQPDMWAPALYVPAAAALFLVLLPPQALEHEVGRQLNWIPFGVLGLAGLLLEATVGGGASRAGVLLLSPLAIWKGWAEPRMDRLPWLAALFFLAALLLWALPDWHPTGEVVAIEGSLQAVLPGAWAPAVIVPLLLTAAFMAGLHVAAGLVLEARAERPLPWAALAAAVPVLTLLVTYVQVERFQRDALWALTAGGLAAGLTLAAWRARSANSLPRAGTHAAGAAAALALGCAMVLHDQWLTLAVALFLPPLAVIEARADLPPLRLVALVAAAIVLVRLLLNVWVLDYAFGSTPVVNGLLLAYGVPAACFGLAAHLFRRRGDDRTVAVLEAGAIAFASVLVALEIRHGLAGGDLRGDFGFREAALQVAALAVEASLLLRLPSRPVLAGAARLLGAMALAGGWLLVVFNPAFVAADAGWTSLAAGYAVPGLLAALALRGDAVPGARQMLGAYAVVAGFVVLGLGIRLAFHPDAMALDAADVEDGELWAYSGAWMLYGAALMGLGISRADRALRLAALTIVGLVAGKVFLVDMADLAGLWRVLSFLGLGLALIAVGAVYRRFVIQPPPPG
jgi:uncharacterized membrane protein